MSKSLRLVTAAAALAALGGAPPASATPVSEWLSATVSSSAQLTGGTSSMGPQSVSERIDKLPLLSGQTVTLADGRSFDATDVFGTVTHGQMDWNIANALQVDSGTLGFERATLGLGMALSQQWQELRADGLPSIPSFLFQTASTEVTAQFRLDAVTDARMFGSSGSLEVYNALLDAGLMVWSEVLAAWQALESPVPDLVLGQSFEWEARLGPGLYQWRPYLTLMDLEGFATSLAFDTSFDLTLELSEVAAPPPPVTGVPEPGTWALVAAGLAAWRTGRRRSVAP